MSEKILNELLELLEDVYNRIDKHDRYFKSFVSKYVHSYKLLSAMTQLRRSAKVVPTEEERDWDEVVQALRAHHLCTNRFISTRGGRRGLYALVPYSVGVDLIYDITQLRLEEITVVQRVAPQFDVHKVQWKGETYIGTQINIHPDHLDLVAQPEPSKIIRTGLIRRKKEKKHENVSVTQTAQAVA